MFWKLGLDYVTFSPVRRKRPLRRMEYFAHFRNSYKNRILLFLRDGRKANSNSRKKINSVDNLSLPHLPVCPALDIIPEVGVVPVLGWVEGEGVSQRARTSGEDWKKLPAGDWCSHCQEEGGHPTELNHLGCKSTIRRQTLSDCRLSAQDLIHILMMSDDKPLW